MNDLVVNLINETKNRAKLAMVTKKNSDPIAYNISHGRILTMHTPLVNSSRTLLYYDSKKKTALMAKRYCRRYKMHTVLC